MTRYRLRRAWAWITSAWAAAVLIAVLITAIVAATSYEHEYQLAWRNGQPAWVAALLPFTVDGMILGASVVLLWAARNDTGFPVRPYVALGVGIAATVGANLGASFHVWWFRPAVSAWSGLALVLAAETAMWLARARQKLSAPAGDTPVVSCSCPPPPATVEEALPVAHAERLRRGLPVSRAALATAFGVTEHRVRAALAEPSPNGHKPQEEVTV